MNIFETIKLQREAKPNIFEQIKSERETQLPAEQQARDKLLGAVDYAVRMPERAPQFGKSENYQKFRTAWEAEKKSLQSRKWRFTKDMYNSMIAQPFYELAGKIPHVFMASQENLKAFEAELDKPNPDFDMLHRNITGEGTISETANPFKSNVPDPEGVVDYAKDITAGITSFVVKLAILKKVFPTLPQSGIWELENLSRGGRPGKGVVDCMVFNTPGKFIKGTSKLAQAGKLIAESSTFAGYNAIEQKLTTGDIDTTEVAIAAGIPIGMKGFGSLVKAGVKLKSPRITTAIVKATPEKYRARVNAAINPDIQRVKATRVERKALPGKKQMKTLPPAQKALPMSKSEMIDRKAAELYDDLLEGFHEGNKRSGQKLARLMRGQNLPTLNELYEKVNAGDKTAAEAIQKGLYAGSPESIVEGLKKEAEKALKIPAPKSTQPMLKGSKRVGKFKTEPGVEKPISNDIYEVTYMGNKMSSAKPIPNATSVETAPLQQEVNAVADELVSWVTKAKKYRQKIAPKVLAAFHKKQAGKGTKILEEELKKEGANPWSTIGKSKAGLKGKVKYKEFDPPELSMKQWKSIRDKILEVYPKGDTSVFFQRLESWTAFDKIRRGLIPTNSEFEKIAPIIGEEAAQQMWLGLQKGRPFSYWELPKLFNAMLKTKFGLDNQTARQASTAKYKHPALYSESTVMNEKARWSNNYAEKADASLKNSPGFADSAKYLNYVGDRGFRSGRLEYYGLGFTERLLTAEFKSDFLNKTFGKAFRNYGKLLEANERGASVGINNMMKGMWDLYMKDLSKMDLTPSQVTAFKESRGKTINTILKILRAKSPQGKQIQEVANYVLFSPSMTASRPLHLKAIVANKGSRAYAADILARNVAGNHLTSMLFAGIGNNMRSQNPTQEPMVDGNANPISGQWGKFKIGSVWYDISGGDAPFYRTLARIGASAYAAGREYATGYKTTRLGDMYVQEGGETLSNYIETRESAMVGFAKTMVTGKDWMGEPIPRFEATVRALSPELIEAMYDAGRADGLWSMIMTGSAAAGSVGTATYEPLAASTRRKYRDIRANQEYKTDWDNLTPSEQKIIKTKYNSEFKELDERVRIEREANPFDPTKLKEEEIEWGDIVTENLKPENAAKLGDKTLGVSRRPENFYLNDERQNAYVNLISSELDKLLDGYKVKNPDKKVIDSFVDMAKKLAFTKLKAAIEAKQL